MKHSKSKHSKSFLAVSVGIVLAGALLAGPFVDADARTAVFAGGLVVLGTQLPLHFLLAGWRERNDRFMAAVVAGFVARVAVLAAVVAVLVIPGRIVAAPFLLALGGFMVAVLIAEAAIESRRIRALAAEAAEAAPS